MAKEVILVDDLDGSRATETVVFSLDRRDYEIDLSTKNAEGFRKAFEKYTQVARPLEAQKVRGGRRLPKSYDIAALRSWAAASKVKLPRRGRIPNSVVARFLAQG